MEFVYSEEGICTVKQHNKSYVTKNKTLFEASFKYKELTPGLDEITNLINSLEDVSNHFLTRSEFDSSLNSPSSYFSELLRTIIQTNAYFEKGIKLGASHNNPLIYNSCFEPSKKVSLSDLSSKKVLLSYSNGKESTLLRHFFTEMPIKFDTVFIHDIIQHTELPSDFQILLGNIDSWSPLRQPLMSIGIPTPIVVYQRLLLWAYADSHGYDYVIFGDEIDNQALYTVDGMLYPSSSFFQSQYFYNALNNMEISDTQLVAGLMNFSQERVYEYLIKHNINHFSCFRNNSGWCNNCSKCKTTAYFATLHNSNMYTPYGLDRRVGYSQYVDKKGLALDFSQFYRKGLASRSKPLMDDGFKVYYERHVLDNKPDNNPNIYYDFKEFNSFETEVLDRFAEFWKD